MRYNRGYSMDNVFTGLVVVAIALSILGGMFGNCTYKIVMSKTITAKVIEIQNIQPAAFMGGQNSSMVFSSALLFQTKDGETISSSADDRQWFIVKKDNCVEARIFPYPFWNFEKHGTYYGARLLKIIPCEK